MLIDHLDIMPTSQCVHEMHHVLALGRETSNRLPFDDGLASFWIDHASIYRWPMADATHDSAVGVDFGSDSLQPRCRWIVNQRSVARGSKEDAILRHC